MCLMAAAVPQAATEWVGRQEQAYRRTSKATRRALQKPRAHVAHASSARLQMNESQRPFPMSTPRPQVLLRRDPSRARIRLELTVDRPGLGPHGGDAGHGSGVNPLHPIPQLSPIGSAQPEPATRLFPLEILQPP